MQSSAYLHNTSSCDIWHAFFQICLIICVPACVHVGLNVLLSVSARACARVCACAAQFMCVDVLLICPLVYVLFDVFTFFDLYCCDCFCSSPRFGLPVVINTCRSM